MSLGPGASTALPSGLGAAGGFDKRAEGGILISRAAEGGGYFTNRIVIVRDKNAERVSLRDVRSDV